MKQRSAFTPVFTTGKMKHHMFGLVREVSRIQSCSSRGKWKSFFAVWYNIESLKIY